MVGVELDWIVRVGVELECGALRGHHGGVGVEWIIMVGVELEWIIMVDVEL